MEYFHDQSFRVKSYNTDYKEKQEININFPYISYETWLMK